MKQILITMLSVLALLSCTPADNDSQLQSAERAIEASDASTARRECSRIADTASLTPSQLCRLAIVYSRIAEMTNDETDMASAAMCYNRAAAAAPDSVDAFLETLSVADLERMAILRQVGIALADPADFRLTDIAEYADTADLAQYTDTATTSQP